MYAQYSWKVPYPKRRVLFFSFRLTGLLDQSSLSLSRSRWSEPRTDVTSWISLPAPMQEERERERNESQRYPHPWLLAQYTDRAQQLQSLRFRIPSAYGLHLRAAFNQSLISHTLLRREARTHLERWIIERRWPTARARRPSATPIGSSK